MLPTSKEWNMPNEPLPSQETLIRRWQRFQLDVPVCVVVERDGKSLIVRGRFKNMSNEGIAVVAGIEMRVDSELFVEFTPAFEGPPIRVCGVVRHRRGYTYGIEFLPRNAHEEQEIETLKKLLMATAPAAEGTPADRR
jgi:hypothetical protein